MPHTACRILILSLIASLRGFAAQADSGDRRPQSTWTDVARVVAVGDVHGDYDAFVAVLRSAGVIDQKGRWSGGKTHLVQTGDVPDRGPDTRKVMDLLMTLEKDAAKAGGQVHALIGNHEAMNLYGDLRYTTPGEFAAFRTGNSEEVRAAFWEEQAKTLPSPPDEAARKKWEAEHPLGWVEHAVAFSPKGKYGKWIRSHNAVVRINDSIFLHGGISPRYASLTVQQIDDLIAAELLDVTKIKDGDPVTGEDGPLWYRGLAQDPEAALSAHVEQLLKTHGIRRIVIGHTPTAGAVIPRFGGKVIVIDVGMTAVFGAHRACLVLEGGQAFAMHRGQKLPLPTGGPADFVSYLKKASSLEPPGSSLAKYVAEVEAIVAR